ncbi:hypothetical protein EG328_006176 [Venturia inaequalis]|uniref:Aldehyde dehydrogenase domain-containing protein n=1 Tax=Venturia inaequalis TaxID=5025 RepID=A0A8H3UH42_VENIN|nr:hypothetical protein EG328_006176 [Venturia inaequalis]RDI84653.1 hypothetical protein Vi05172_g5197 [Venturia inaequalis]
MQATQVGDNVDGENEQGPQNYKMQYDKIPGYIAEGNKEDFGGYKESGIGREYCDTALDNYTKIKTV